MAYSLPSLPSNIDPAVRRYLESIKELLEVRTAQRGNPLDASPTFRDLLDSGVIRLTDNNTLIAGGKQFTPGQLVNLLTSTVPDWLTSDTAPPPPTGLTVTANVATVELLWNATGFDNYDHTEIWRATQNNLSLAEQIGSTSGTSYVDILPPTGSNYYYWIRDVSRSGISGAFNDVNGASAFDVPGTLNLTFAGFNGEHAELHWSAPTSNLAIAYYELRLGTNWSTPQEIITINANSYSYRINAPAPTWTFWVAAVDVNGNAGIPVSVVVNVASPSAPSVSGIVIGAKYQLTWTVPTTHSLPIVEYRITNDTSTEVIRTLGTNYRVPVDWLGVRTFSVVAVDTAGNIGAAGTSVLNSAAPSAPNPISTSFLLDSVVVEWGEPSTTVPIEDYEVRVGDVADDWINADPYAFTKSTKLTIRVDWLGSRRFFVRARDISGNEGAIASTIAEVSAPTAADVFYTQVVDNNVLLYWSGVVGTLPIATYELWRGNTFATAELIGEKSGGFTSVFETAGGTYTYWIRGVDTAGNRGVEKGVSAAVSQPPDYVLDVDYDSLLSPALDSDIKLAHGIYENGTVVFPVDHQETYEQHFTSNSWTTPQQQVDAGYPIYIQPNTTQGHFEEIYDYGALLSASKVTLTLLKENISGNPTITPKISLSTDGTNWTDYDGFWSVYGTSFRYVKFRLTVATSAATDLVRFLTVNLKLDRKLLNDAGKVDCLSTDSGGTQVNFSTEFADVASITVTPLGTTPVIAMYDFLDVPYPTGFKILLFNTSGVRVSGTASWSARGY
jgi:hypothetical protein